MADAVHDIGIVGTPLFWSILKINEGSQHSAWMVQNWLGYYRWWVIGKWFEAYPVVGHEWIHPIFLMSSHTDIASFLSWFSWTQTQWHKKTSAILFLKAYVELYAGKLQKQNISYKTFPQTTHTVMVLILLSSIAFHLALWPVFGSTSMLIMFLIGMFIVNFCLLMPTSVQNLVAFVLLTFFLQEYS